MKKQLIIATLAALALIVTACGKKIRSYQQRRHYAEDFHEPRMEC
jgi:outer membrane lipopolysaccharide assembly protein LptE/RlpB